MRARGKDEKVKIWFELGLIRQVLAGVSWKWLREEATMVDPIP